MRGGDLVVAVAEDVGLDLDHVADHALDRMAAAVELGLDPLDHHRLRASSSRRCSLARGAALPTARATRCGLGVAAEDAERQGLEGDRVGPARTVTAGPSRRDVLEAR